jgi:hypothetical protein
MKRVMLAVIVTSLIFIAGIAVYWVYFKEEPSTLGTESENLESIRPRNMRITEVTTNSFVVSWEVSSNVSGYIRYGDTSTSLSLIAQDDQGTVPAKEHHATVTGLSPGKKYYFWVMSDEVAFGRNGRALEVLTRAE